MLALSKNLDTANIGSISAKNKKILKRLKSQGHIYTILDLEL